MTPTEELNTEALSAELTQAVNDPNVPESALSDNGNNELSAPDPDAVMYGLAFYTKQGYKICIPVSTELDKMPTEAAINETLRTSERIALGGVRGSILSSEIVFFFVITMDSSAPISIVKEDTIIPIGTAA